MRLPRVVLDEETDNCPPARCAAWPAQPPCRCDQAGLERRLACCQDVRGVRRVSGPRAEFSHTEVVDETSSPSDAAFGSEEHRRYLLDVEIAMIDSLALQPALGWWEVAMID